VCSDNFTLSFAVRVKVLNQLVVLDLKVTDFWVLFAGWPHVAGVIYAFQKIIGAQALFHFCLIQNQVFALRSLWRPEWEVIDLLVHGRCYTRFAVEHLGNLDPW
jgi:hypothetical protein